MATTTIIPGAADLTLTTALVGFTHTTNLSFPSAPGFSAVRFGLQANTQTFSSPLNSTTQTLENPGALWFVTYTLPLMTFDTAAPWEAFLAELMGASGRFNGYDPRRTTPRGIADVGDDTPLVNGASQTGKLLITDGWQNNGTALLQPGDYFQVIAGGSKELHMVTQQLNSDGSGNATISFVPPLRESPVDNASIVFESPVAVFRLVDDGQTAWQGSIGDFVPGFSFSAIEAF